MRKYNLKVFNTLYTDYYLITSLEEYQEYALEFNNKFVVSESEINTLKTFMGHGHSMLTGISGMFCGMIDDKDKREPMLAHLKYLQATVLCDQLKHLLEGDKLLINKHGGYFPVKPNQEVEIIEICTDKYTKEDIRVTKWWGGNHWYAKIGSIDVVDNDGVVKWSTEQLAYDKAILYMNELNKRYGTN